jgi:prepilin-type N-terminal cleavage/methylation domain-containing protein
MKKSLRIINAFTLIELLVVISVLGVLVAVILPNLVGVRVRARDSALKNDLHQLKSSLRMYYNDFQVYPTDDDNGNIIACGVDGESVCPNSDGSFAVSENVYMKEMVAADKFDYTQLDQGENFLLSTIMENASDSDISDSVNHCNVTSPGTATYYVCAD